MASSPGKKNFPEAFILSFPPIRAILFELLIDSVQHFSISADTTSLPGSVVFTGCPDNTIFQAYTRYTAAKGKEIIATQKELAAKHSKADSAVIREKLKSLNAELQQYRENLSDQISVFAADDTISTVKRTRDSVCCPAAGRTI